MKVISKFVLLLFHVLIRSSLNFKMKEFFEDMERRSDCGLLIRWNRGLSLPFTQTKHYRLNILDFPHYKVIGDRVVPSDGRTNPCWFADLRYTYAAPLPHKYYESIAEVVLPSPMYLFFENTKFLFLKFRKNKVFISGISYSSINEFDKFLAIFFL